MTTLADISQLSTVLDTLRAILSKNYEALGWKLGTLEMITRSGLPGAVVRGMIECPCGGKEYFNTIMREREFVVGNERTIAFDILSNTASAAHLQSDVASGALPAMDVDKHCFKGTLL